MTENGRRRKSSGPATMHLQYTHFFDTGAKQVGFPYEIHLIPIRPQFPLNSPHPPTVPPTPCHRRYSTRPSRGHERESDAPFGHFDIITALERRQPLRFGRSRMGKPCICLKSSKPVRRMKLAHLSTTELVMMSAQMGGIHLFRKKKQAPGSSTL